MGEYTLSKYILYKTGYLYRNLFYKNGASRIDVKEEKRLKKRDGYPNNFVHFPFNICEPEVVEVNGSRFVRYRAKFNSLHDLYTYLKSHPTITKKVFSSLSSETGSREFAGVSYEDALEELEEAPRAEYSEFLELSDRLDEEALGYLEEYITIRSPGGGAIDIPAYSSGNPFCYKISRSVYTPKFIRINVALSYYCGTSKEQVMNRALIVAALVNAFEQAGYIVEINTFELSKEDNELCEIDVNIKNNDQTFNKASLYKTLCYVEFLRRLLFRVLETLDVKNGWSFGYGETCSEEFVRDAMRMDENDIFIDQPREMGIDGDDIGKDFRAVLNHLKLADKIDVEKAVEEFDKDVMRLRKTIL